VRRFALILLALVLAAPPASALADDQLTIEPEGREPQTLSISQLGEPDVVARPYTLPGAAAPVPVTGYSLDRVLDAASIDPYMFGPLSIQATSGTVQLTRDEATGTTTFPEGPPVFWVENGDARFLRPARTNGELAELASGGPMTMQIAPIGGLSVSAKASPRKAKVGQRVRFTATVTGAAPEETVEISWFFDDGRSGAGSEVTHIFRRPGTYRVAVGATTSEDDPGADAVVTVRVGRAPAGPDRSGGGTNPDDSAPDSGAGTGSTGSTGGSSPAPVTPSAPSTPPSTYEPLDQPPQPQESGGSKSPVEDEGQPADGLESVNGIELADLNALSSDSGRDALEAARRGLKRDEEEPDEGVPDGVWWFLGIGGLLSLGGLLELRRRPDGYSATAQ
jgi:PKD domain